MEDTLGMFLQETTLYNDIVLSHLLPSSLWAPLNHFLQTWLRNYLAGTLLYFVSGFLWCFYIYYLKRNVYLPKGYSVVLLTIRTVEQLTLVFNGPVFDLVSMLSGYFIPSRSLKNEHTLDNYFGFSCYDFNFVSSLFNKKLKVWFGMILPIVTCFFGTLNIIVADAIPSNKSMLLQIYVAMKAMPWYTLLPTVSEHMIENGWTKCYARISDVGWFAYILYLAIYLVIVEFGIYWMHRELHDIKPLYKYLHATHHIYNKQNTLSPFAGLAFHPVDGILQAVPHVIALFVVPTHFRSHIALLFIEAVWTANIHDCIHAKIWPVMGAGYHTIHHTTYRHNYGHYTIWMDWMLGTLRDPEDDASGKDN